MITKKIVCINRQWYACIDKGDIACTRLSECAGERMSLWLYEYSYGTKAVKTMRILEAKNNCDRNKE